MSSGFVPAGTTDEPTKRNEAWLKVQQQLEEKRRQKVEEGKQDGGKSLYEKLQENKAAKQEAFEESIRLKNQFRALNEDEADFLDSVLESERAKEAALKKETTDQLEAFRRQQEDAEKAALGEVDDTKSALVNTTNREQWTRKRRRERDKDHPADAKLRRMSSGKDDAALKMQGKSTKSTPATTAPPKSTEDAADKVVVSSSSGAKGAAVSLGLGGYDSDTD